MKHPIIPRRHRLAAALLAAAAALFMTAAAQQGGMQPTATRQPSEAPRFAVPPPDELRRALPDTLSLRLHGPDTLPRLTGGLPGEPPRVSWRPPLVRPLFPSIRIDRSGRPTRIYVINNIILQVGGYVNVTNGQAWIWSPYPNGYLDARTLSFPLPR